MRKLLFLFFLLIPLTTYAGVEELCSSIVRITDENAQGTGFCYKEDESAYFILTAGHIYVDGDRVDVDLFHDGRIKRVWGMALRRTYVEYTTLDYQVIGVLKKDLEDYPPLKPVKIAKDVKKDGIIWTWGCSDGAWPTLLKGRIKKDIKIESMFFRDKDGFTGVIKESPDMVFISPPPKQGRSGSPVFNDKYELIGMILMTNPPHGGIAVSIDTLRGEIEK